MTFGVEKGYLNSQFRIFHLNDIPQGIIPTHYHDFRKIVVLLDGSIGYMIEDRSYELHAGDVVFVDAGRIHRPVLTGAKRYERLILYLSEEYFAARQGLEQCFDKAREDGHCVINIREKDRAGFFRMALDMRDMICGESRFPVLLQGSRLNEFLIFLNDYIFGEAAAPGRLLTSNETVSAVITYIEDNISGDLSIDTIASRIHMDRSHLSRMFKAETGYTIKEYADDKRLFLAVCKIGQGMTPSEAAAFCGYGSYSSFYRAYVRKYGMAPGGRKTAGLGEAGLIE